VYVRRVREDSLAYDVTERGEPVARLVPLQDGMTRVERMIAEGRIAPATGHVSDLPQPLPGRGERSLSDILGELRDEDSR
jgi:antitoxin (DNA-binding transcriptional repressor) of toxin-antitoxin stability system